MLLHIIHYFFPPQQRRGAMWPRPVAWPPTGSESTWRVRPTPSPWLRGERREDRKIGVKKREVRERGGTRSGRHQNSQSESKHVHNFHTQGNHLCERESERAYFITVSLTINNVRIATTCTRIIQSQRVCIACITNQLTRRIVVVNWEAICDRVDDIQRALSTAEEEGGGARCPAQFRVSELFEHLTDDCFCLFHCLYCRERWKWGWGLIREVPQWSLIRGYTVKMGGLIRGFDPRDK